ncbi:hypothetical protein [Massilia sp. IC2-476]|nr:hypothetical protein [Massilia sp. IC2-476]MCC2970676.1 hypothetical protein [Massilia sp. IC2-476]
MPRTGERDGYLVIDWSFAWDPSLADLLAVAPELVLGRRVAIVSCDSGAYPPSAAELEAGWCREGDVTLSAGVASIDCLPTPGFDEWYVFDDAPAVFPVRQHVNVFGFSVLAENDEARAFWEQVRQCRPRHVLGTGTPHMFVVTRDGGLFERLRNRELLEDTDD